MYPWQLRAFTALALLLLVSPAAAFDPTIIKLHARNTVAQDIPEFGFTVALNEKWILVGERENDDLGTNVGAVHVFSAVTGAYVRKLRAIDGLAGDTFGRSVAVSGNMALIGADGDDDPAVPGGGSGSAYVFNLSTGVQVRKLTADDASADARFGRSVALSGNRALVGATFGNGVAAGCGSAYVFDISTGVQQTKLQATDGAPNDRFGDSVALSGSLALVGARAGDGEVANSGSAYLFDASATGPTTTQLCELNASDGALDDAFGVSVALSGNLALVGASQGDGPVADSGSAYVFDMTRATGGAIFNEVAELNATESVVNDSFGTGVALNGNLALIGAAGGDGSVANTGSAYLFDVATGAQLRKLSAPDGAADDEFGFSCALCGNVAVIGARNDGDLGELSGSAYIFRPLAGPFPMTKVAALNDFAPGTVESSFLAFDDTFLNSDAEVIFTATLSGTGAPSTKNQGVWDSLDGGQLDLLLRKGDAAPVAPGVVSGLFKPISNQTIFSIFEATFSGAGVTTANNRALFGDDGSPPLIQLLRLGDEPLDDEEKLAKFLQVAQTTNSNKQQAVAIQLTLGTGTPPDNVVTSSKDISILVLDGSGAVLEALREGSPSTAVTAPVYGQFSRVSFPDSQTVFTSAIQSVTASNQGVFRSSTGGVETLVARKGAQAPGGTIPAGVLFSSFTGETTSTDEETVFRATLSGTGVTTANDDGLWSEHNGPVAGNANSLVARENDPLPDTLGFPPTVRWSQFISFWGIRASPDQVLFLARIKGPGITTDNDVGLWLMQGTGNYQLLMREGDVAPHCATGKIGVIQRVVAVPSNGRYAVLASLTNSALTSNQALFTGNTGVPVARAALRRAFLKLRKGTLYQSPAGSTTTLKSLSLPASAFDATGAGAKGLGQPINLSGEMVLPVLFDNGVKELMTGVP
jgi:hypothetical protein